MIIASENILDVHNKPNLGNMYMFRRASESRGSAFSGKIKESDLDTSEVVTKHIADHSLREEDVEFAEGNLSKSFIMSYDHENAPTIADMYREEGAEILDLLMPTGSDYAFLANIMFNVIIPGTPESTAPIPCDIMGAYKDGVGIIEASATGVPDEMVLFGVDTDTDPLRLKIRIRVGMGEGDDVPWLFASHIVLTRLNTRN